MIQHPQLALVTGASSGIGLELAQQCVAQGADVILVARRAERLADIQRDWERRYARRVHVLAIDLSEPGAALHLARQLEAQGLQPDCLINNAGLGGLGDFAHMSTSQISAQLMVNIVALTELTRLLLPAMVGAGRGTVLQVASMAAFVPGPLQAVYYASKAYVLNFSEALRRELRGSGVSVTTLCPGPTESGFLQAAGGPAGNVYRASSARAVAQAGYRAMMRGDGVALTDRRLALQLRLLPRKLLLDISYQRNRKILAAKPPPAIHHAPASPAMAGAQAVQHSSPSEYRA